MVWAILWGIIKVTAAVLFGCAAVVFGLVAIYEFALRGMDE